MASTLTEHRPPTKQEPDGRKSTTPLPPPPSFPQHDQRSFVPGYEPSAPPLPPHLNHLDASQSYFTHDHDEMGFLDRLRAPYTQENETLGSRLVDTLGFAFKKMWRTSHTVLRLDIRRAIRLQGPIMGERRGRGQDGAGGRESSGFSGSPQGSSYGSQRNGNADDWERRGQLSKGWLNGIEGGGARIKLMQIWDFPSKDTGEPSLPWNLSFGVGARIEMDRGGRLEPQMRLRAKHAALHLLPSPLLEFRGKWPLGGTKLAVNVHYRIPLLHLDTFWESPSAQLLINFSNPMGTGFHLTPGGLEFDEHVVNIGKHTTMRVAASIEFPRQFPLEEGEQPIRIHVHRLGLKARIM